VCVCVCVCVLVTVGVERCVVTEDHPARKVGLRHWVGAEVGEPRGHIKVGAAVILRRYDRCYSDRLVLFR